MKHLLGFKIFEAKTKPKPVIAIFSEIDPSMDYRIVQFIADNFEIYKKSPYSSSFYNKDKKWDVTIENTYRVSDHWNFESNGKLHCPTRQSVVNNTHWSLGVWKNGKWDILMSYPRAKNKPNLKKIMKIREQVLEKHKNAKRQELTKFSNLIEKGELFADINLYSTGKLESQWKKVPVLRKGNKAIRFLDGDQTVNLKHTRHENSEIKLYDADGNVIYTKKYKLSGQVPDSFYEKLKI